MLRNGSPSPGRRRSAAFTLIEMIASLIIMSILMVAMGGALMMSSQAVPDADNRTMRIAQAADVLDQITSELTYAIAVTEMTATAVTFTVADRDADSSPETIRYAWSGDAGDPLTRQYKGGTIVEIAQNVEEFELDYITRTETTTETKTEPTVSAEALLASFTGWITVAEPDEQLFRVDRNYWATEQFTVSDLPASASKLTITRVFLQMCQSTLGDAGTFSVGVHLPAVPGDPEPAASPIGTPITRSSSTLGSSPAWVEFTFSDVEIASPGTDYVIVVKGSDADTLARDAEVMRYYAKGAPANGCIGQWTLDQGGTWSPGKIDEYDHPFEVYGTYESTGSHEVEIDHKLLAIIAVKLQVASVGVARVETAARILNEPEVEP